MILTPDQRVHRSVLLFAAFAMAGGGVVVLHLPLAPGWRALLLSGWLCLQSVGIYRFAVAAAGWRKLRFVGADRLTGRRHGAGWTRLVLQPGTFASTRFVWLRLAAASGEQFQMLLLAARCRPDDWRRLQVILRLGH